MAADNRNMEPAPPIGEVRPAKAAKNPTPEHLQELDGGMTPRFESRVPPLDKSR